ncbi:glycoside hydrolase family 43 protein [Asticcacaulis sp. SL142]|uniref:glycoside hydrolase family 43 protein n=1 Tax=Asticcacaulis sp. SL142 TaxID=2995155 RepID=UPI00226CA3C8|nr:glycoside hydrolase family 43 protein [Asticcacaulis sp. SL142]WAC47883.1 glycoside hydrolase family 43 protein [Asticcacaulis sp. SL142]
MLKITPLILASLMLAGVATAQPRAPGSNPLITDIFTADPAPLVVGDTVYLYTGHDEARGKEMFTMKDWRVFSSKDLLTWTAHGPIMNATDFKWAAKDAWAAQTIEKNGKFYFYAAVEHDKTQPGKAIGVAVSDSPTGPFVDARGTALITNQMTPQGPHTWDDIDPTVFIDDDGTAWLIWGNFNCYYAKLKPNMIELDGPIKQFDLPHFEEGPWITKRGDIYYLTYASRDKSKDKDETISYATAPSITGPWTYQGVLTGSGKNSFTIHPGIITFKGKDYFFYHDASLTIGDQTGAIGRRAVRAEHLYYNPDGTMQPVEQTEAGLSAPRKP